MRQTAKPLNLFAIFNVFRQIKYLPNLGDKYDRRRTQTLRTEQWREKGSCHYGPSSTSSISFPGLNNKPKSINSSFLFSIKATLEHIFWSAVSMQPAPIFSMFTPAEVATVCLSRPMVPVALQQLPKWKTILSQKWLLVYFNSKSNNELIFRRKNAAKWWLKHWKLECMATICLGESLAYKNIIIY